MTVIGTLNVTLTCTGCFILFSLSLSYQTFTGGGGRVRGLRRGGEDAMMEVIQGKMGRRGK